ncbi:MAG: hypothetical protein PHX18_03810 [Candidatus Gastranaerophilales bacterium]|nr:hypothetical protein [Candidatus Gastranaerophilales bacterium]
MLPIITEEQKDLIFAEILKDLHSWRRGMIHYMKDENPEVNAAIIDIATNTNLDPKAVALGAYMIYKILEMADAQQNEGIQQFLDDQE